MIRSRIDRLYRALLRRTPRACAVIAVGMVIVALSYITWAVIDTDAAQGWWWPYAIVECVLSLWNLAVYSAKDRARKERMRQRASR